MPIAMPCTVEIASPESMWKTSPSAVICAATQPRYEIAITTALKISTPRP